MTDVEPPSLRSHARYGAKLLAALLVVAWLANPSGAPVSYTYPLLLGVVAAGGIAYRAATALPRFERLREELVFAVVLLTTLGVMGTLSGWNATYLTVVTITALIFALFALGLNLQYGFTGIINFGHVAFMGTGAYATALLTERWAPHAETLTRPGLPAVAALAAAAILLFLVVATLASIVAERLTTDATSRLPVAAGVVTGLVAAVAVPVVASYPLTPIWARLHVAGGAVLAGMGLAGFLGIVLGVPTLRLRDDYLAIVTIGAAEILRRVWVNEEWLTNGTRGLNVTPPYVGAAEAWAWLQPTADALFLRSAEKGVLLIAVVVALLLTYLTAEILVGSPYGRVLRAIREDEEVAEALGKNVFNYKLQSLAIGSMVGALAGALLAWQNRYINPRTFLPLFTFYAWIIVVIGGIGNNRGTVLGALVLYTFLESTKFLPLEERLGVPSSQAASIRFVLIGLLLVAVMMYKPEGLLGSKEEMVHGD